LKFTLKDSSLSNTQLLTTAMHNSTNPNLNTSGIMAPPVQSQQPFPMQSTTPSTANGKDEMRGWLYKWTNVKKKASSFEFKSY